jgi:tetratricopeptide (TPR) repeat protein
MDTDQNMCYTDAKQAYAQGDFQHAYTLFESLSALFATDAELNFYVGRCALELRRYDEAMAAFDRVLILNPRHTRTHLELSRLYYEQHQLEMARIELDVVLNEQLPNDVRNTATAFKRKIDGDLSPHRFSGAFVIGGGFDNNVNNDIGNHAFNIPSLNLPISGNPKEKDGYGFSTFVFNHSYDFGDKGGWSLENSFIAYDKLYSKSSLNNLVLFSLTSAPTWSDNELRVALPIMFDRVYIDGKGYLYNVGAGIKNSYLIDPSSMIEGGYTFKRGYYHDEAHDVNTHLLFADYRRIVGDNLFSIALQTSYAINQEVESTRTDVEYNEFKYGLELSKEFSKTLRGALSYTKADARYQEIDSAFLTKRHDDIDLYELSLNYALQKNIGLGLNVSYSDHQSNHAPYDYGKTNALLSVMWTF